MPNTTDFAEFADSVLSKLDFDGDKEMLKKYSLPELFESGFSERDAVAFCRCIEDVSPDMNEEYALRRMDQLRAKYKKGLSNVPT